MVAITPNFDFPTFWKAKYFPALDGLRALCVLMVMFNHIHVPYPRWIAGWMGVDVFFVLSGFLITTLLIRERETSGRVSLKGFYIRRFFRIVPVYFVVLALYIPALWASHDAVKISEFKSALPYLLGFVQEFRPAAAGNIFGHAWTLGIEEKFYLFWPLLVVSSYPFRRRSVAVVIAIAIATLSLPHLFARSYGGLLIGAILGIALSQSSNWLSGMTLPRVQDWLLCLGVIAAYGLALYNAKLVLLFSGSIALLVASLALRVGWLRNVLSSRALVFIGKRSYAMYLSHILAINAVEKILPRFTTPTWFSVVALSYVASLLGACLLQAAVERPCIAFGKRLSASISGASSMNGAGNTREPLPLIPGKGVNKRSFATSD